MNSRFYSEDIKFTFDDVMLVPERSDIPSRSDAHIDTSIKMGKNTFKIPLITSNMDTITDIKMAIKMAELGGLGIIHRYMSVADTSQRIYKWSSLDNFKKGWPLALSVGSIDNEMEKQRLDAILRDQNRYWADDQIILCIDLAHGDSRHMMRSIAAIRDEYKFTGTLIAGNTATIEGTQRLLSAGADIIRVGIGGGSACTTRQKTGCGIPQLSSVMDSAKAGSIISDGGHRIPADVAKAIAGGADFVMVGGMMAGTDCTPHWDEAMAHHNKSLQFGGPNELPEVSYRGMASKEAREAFSGIGKNAEGASFRTKIKPPNSTHETVEYIMEGVRSAMSYTNNTNIKDFQTRSKFIRVTPTTIQENIPHFGIKSK